MSNLLVRFRVPSGLAMTSLVLGHISLILAFLPILGIPLAAAGVVFGVLGLLACLFSRMASARWSLAGLVVSTIALGMGIGLYLAPYGDWTPQPRPERWQPIPHRVYVPPPASPMP